MILLDSIYINNGGGKVLLDYLVEKLSESKLDVFYLFDERVKGNYEHLPAAKQAYMKSSLIKRHSFYKKNLNTFTAVLCFGNLPPSISLKVPVYTYFHTTLFLSVPEGFSFVEKVKFWLKVRVLAWMEKNTHYWLVQSKVIKKGLGKKFNIADPKIKILPFYPSSGTDGKVIERKPHTYLYVSSGAPHKNHLRLIEAFIQFYDQTKKGELTLTVDHVFADLVLLIERKSKEGYPIINIGHIERERLLDIYQQTEFLIFPSLTETFGLGLIEGIENGCKVIAADLPYTYEVCKPSLIFDPQDVTSLYQAFMQSESQQIPFSKPLITNNITNLISLLNKQSC